MVLGLEACTPRLSLPKTAALFISFLVITATTIITINGLQLFNGWPLSIIAAVAVSLSFHQCRHPFPLSLTGNATSIAQLIAELSHFSCMHVPLAQETDASFSPSETVLATNDINGRLSLPSICLSMTTAGRSSLSQHECATIYHGSCRRL
jgi:hypothetical protein